MSEAKSGLPILAFATAADWEAFLAAQPADSPGLWLKLAKQGAGVASVTKAQAVEGALVHGWIDGQLDKYDDRFWLIRFTPRKVRSPWSAINRAAALKLIEAGRMAPAGLAQVEAARADGRWDAAYAPQSQAQVPDDLARALDASPAAKALFERLDATNRYAVLHRVNTAKTDKTRAARIDRFVTMLAHGDTIYPLKART
jgi:uncharacterized protein YdeI (YjbR/CyaY-like superfamily)